MDKKNVFDVIVIGGSYSGMAAAMALGRAIRRVLVLDAGKPCNRHTPYSHNFLTRDGEKPEVISEIGRQQLNKYRSITWLNAKAISGDKVAGGFRIGTEGGAYFQARKLIFATGIRDIFPPIEGFEESWGKSVLHCPYCHGYEVRNQKTGILGNGDSGYELAMLISNWSSELTIFTNGEPGFSNEQEQKLKRHNILIKSETIERLEHKDGMLKNIKFINGVSTPLQILYSPLPFVQNSPIPEALGCELTELGYIKTDVMQKTTIPGVFASGDGITRMRTVANAVATGTTAGMMANKEMILEDF